MKVCDNYIFTAALHIMKQIKEQIKAPNVQVNAYIAGGMAVSYWIGEGRICYSVNAILSHRIVLPNLYSELVVDDKTRNVIFDHNFHNYFLLIHKDYRERATEVAIYDNLHVHVFAPVDLVIMKISRLFEEDIDDIELLIKNKLVDKKEFEYLVDKALRDYVGDPALFQTNLKIIGDIFDKFSDGELDFVFADFDELRDTF